MRGLQKSDADSMTLGMWIDYIIEYNQMQADAIGQAENHSREKPVIHSRMATQSDFDNF